MTKDERRTKYTDIARKRREKKHDQQRKQQVTCYNCRQQGHFASDCPSKEKSDLEASICYKCGSTEHSLSGCPKNIDGNTTVLPFASCFVCKEKGHISAKCPKNTKGVYVNSGECRYCGSREHLASKCPNKKKDKTTPQEKVDDHDVEHLLESEISSRELTSEAVAAAPRKRVVKF